MPKVTVLPADLSAEVASGELLLHAGEKAGVEMEAGCFNCSCGTCAVEVVSGMENSGHGKVAVTTQVAVKVHAPMSGIMHKPFHSSFRIWNVRCANHI